MRKQANNIAVMPYEQRRLVSRMLFDRVPYRQIREQLKRQFPQLPVPHDSSLIAWQRNPEFVRYRDAREADREELEQTRAMAQALNDGQGPQSTADLVVMEVVRELHRQIRGGQITDLDNLGAVTKALAPLMRAQAAQELADGRRREADLAAEIERLEELHAAEVAAKDAEIARLQKRLEAAAATSGAMDPKQRREVMDAVNEFVGGKAT